MQDIFLIFRLFVYMHNGFSSVRNIICKFTKRLTSIARYRPYKSVSFCYPRIYKLLINHTNLIKMRTPIQIVQKNETPFKNPFFNFLLIKNMITNTINNASIKNPSNIFSVVVNCEVNGVKEMYEGNLQISNAIIFFINNHSPFILNS